MLMRMGARHGKRQTNDPYSGNGHTSMSTTFRMTATGREMMTLARQAQLSNPSVIRQVIKMFTSQLKESKRFDVSSPHASGGG